MLNHHQIKKPLQVAEVPFVLFIQMGEGEAKENTAMQMGIAGGLIAVRGVNIRQNSFLKRADKLYKYWLTQHNEH
jgi:DNA gyrase inhibitor GyrI